MRLLLDTNILIDYHLRRMPHWENVARIVAAGIFGDVQIWASTKSYTDVFYVAGKLVDPDELQQAFLKSFELIRLCSIDPEDIERAATLAWPNFEDCLVGIAAEKVKADAIVTRDAGGFARSQVEAMRPEQVLDALECERGLFYDRVVV